MSCKESIYCRDNPHNPRLREIFSILRNAGASAEDKAQAAREWTEMSLFHPEKWDEYFARPSSGRTVQKRLDYYNRQLSSFDLRPNLQSIQTPMLICCGQHDSQCPPNFSQEIHRLTPGSKLHIFDDSNHCPHLEEPETFRAAVRTFLTE